MGEVSQAGEHDEPALRILYPQAFVICPGKVADLMALPAGVKVLIGEITSPFRVWSGDDDRSDRQYMHDLLDVWLDRYGSSINLRDSDAQ